MCSISNLRKPARNNSLAWMFGMPWGMFLIYEYYIKFFTTVRHKCNRFGNSQCPSFCNGKVEIQQLLISGKTSQKNVLTLLLVFESRSLSFSHHVMQVLSQSGKTHCWIVAQFVGYREMKNYFLQMFLFGSGKLILMCSLSLEQSCSFTA